MGEGEICVVSFSLSPENIIAVRKECAKTTNCTLFLATSYSMQFGYNLDTINSSHSFTVTQIKKLHYVH